MVEILAANDGYPAVYFGKLRGKCECRSNVLDFESRIVLDNLRRRKPLRQRIQNDGDTDSSATDKGFAVADLRVHGDSCQQILVGHLGAIFLYSTVVSCPGIQ